MSSLPVIERISAIVIARLENITIDNGYPFNVPSVDRVDRTVADWKPRNLAIAVKQGSTVENEEMTHEGNPAAIGYDTLFQLHGFVRHPDNQASDADSKTENQLDAAIKRSIAGTHDWQNFSGEAIDARWTQTTPFVSPEGDHAGITVGLLITYRISEDDPTESRA